MKSGAKKQCFFSFFSCLLIIAQAQISIDSLHSFQPSLVGEEFGVLENTADPDSGGVLTIWIRNNGSNSDSVVAVSVCNKNGDTLQLKTWGYWWGLGMEPVGNVQNLCAVVIKSQSASFSNGSDIRVNVFTRNGWSAAHDFLLQTSSIKIANVLPNQELTKLFIYLRNDGNNTLQLKSLELNQVVFMPGSLSINAISGSNVAPKQIKIIEVSPAQILQPLEPLFLKIDLAEVSTAKNVSLISFTRLVPAQFSFGTWDSPLFDANKEAGRKAVRQLNIEAVHGPGNPTLMQDAYNEYHMQTLWEPSLSNISGTVSNNSNSNYVMFWSIDDEPDLNNKNIDTQLIKNNTYWQNDNNTPSYVNLCVQKKYNRYGWYADVVSMDHYTDNGAPNVIPLSWITRKGSPREAIEYTEVLKWNTEPRRMRTWCQLAVKGTWKFQPEDYIINYQFWAHAMSGAKGIDFFCAKPSTLTDFPKQWNEAKKLVEQCNPLKNLLLYAEPLNTVKTSYAGDVETRLLVGKDYAVLIVLNDSIDYTLINVFNQEWRSDIWRKNFSFEFELPSWVQTANVYEQTPTGKVAIQGLTNLGNNQYQLQGEIFKNSRVFVFAPMDNEAPKKPERLVFADVTSPNAYTLSWQEPFDNFGVKGYELRADGNVFATTLHPIFDAVAAPNLCEFSNFEVVAFDEAGNKSLAATIASPGFNGSGAVGIINSLRDTTVDAGNKVVFSVLDTISSTKGYQWKYQENGNVSNVIDNNTYSGAYTASLTINATQNENGKQYFCVINSSCTNKASSNSATLTVNGTAAIGENTAAEIELFPNPNNGQFIIKTQVLNNYFIRIFNHCGKLVFSAALDKDYWSGDISNLPSGLYSVLISNSTSTFNKRFIKN
jgi:hypothetical protein